VINELQWEDFKNFVTRKNLKVSIERESRGYGFFIAADGPLIYRCRVPVDRSIYKDALALISNDPISQKISGTMESDGLSARFVGGFLFEAPPMQETIDNYVLSENRIFDGVAYESIGNWNDQITFQVVHPIGGVIDQFAYNFYVSSQPVVLRVYKARLVSGLIMRVIYRNNGENVARFKANLFLHEES
jgi:hypothetical protein